MPTKISWCDETWNPITGCSPISPGCNNCYAKRQAQRFKGRFGYPEDEPFQVTWRINPGYWNSITQPEMLNRPFTWRKPRKIFVCSMGDLFHEDIPRQALEIVFRIMYHNRRHTYLLLTKRPLIAKKFFDEFVHTETDGVFYNSPAYQHFLKNIWLGITAENQETANKRIPILLDIPAAVRFVSVEPMLEDVYLAPYTVVKNKKILTSKNKIVDKRIPKIDWVICGGETGARAREMQSVWAANLYDQCRAANIPFFFKQLGNNFKRAMKRDSWLATKQCKEFPSP